MYQHVSYLDGSKGVVEHQTDIWSGHFWGFMLGSCITYIRGYVDRFIPTYNTQVLCSEWYQSYCFQGIFDQYLVFYWRGAFRMPACVVLIHCHCPVGVLSSDDTIGLRLALD